MTCVKLHCPADLLKLTTAAHAARRTALQVASLGVSHSSKAFQLYALCNANSLHRRVHDQEFSVDATDDERRGLEAALLKRTVMCQKR